MMSIMKDDSKRDLDDEIFLNYNEGKIFRYSKLNLPYSRQEKTIFNRNFVPHREAQNIKSPAAYDLGKLLLMHSKSGDYSKVHILLTKGAPFATDWLGMSPLHFAAKNNHAKVCDLLIRAGVSKDGRTKVDKTPLHFAAYEGHESVVQLLLEKKCDVNAKDMLKMTPLHWAIEKRHKSIAKLLIQHGADVSCISKFDKTPISMAIELDQSDLIDELNSAKEVQCIEKSLMDVVNIQKETNQAVESIFGKSLHFEYDFENDIKATVIENEDDSKTVPLKSNSDHDRDDGDVDTKDEKNKYVEPIIQLENMSDDSHEAEASVLELLKSHGISLLPQEDPATSFISSALKSGRRFVLSEAGKLVLNETKLRQKSKSPERKVENNKLSQIKIKDENEKSIIKKKPLILKAKEIPTSSGKKFKVISVETLKKMCGEELVNSLKKMKQGKNEKQIITHITKLSSKKESNEENAEDKILTANKNVVEKTKESKEQKGNIIENDLPPNIEICTDSDQESDINIHIENEDKSKQKSKVNLKFHEDNVDDSNDDSKDDDGKISYYRKSLPIQTHNKTSTIINKSLATNKTPIILNSQTISSLNHNIDNPEILLKRKSDINRSYMMKKIQSNMKKESPIVPLLNIPEICRQLYELKKQTEELKKCNEEYRIRIEKLERKSLKD